MVSRATAASFGQPIAELVEQVDRLVPGVDRFGEPPGQLRFVRVCLEQLWALARRECVAVPERTRVLSAASRCDPARGGAARGDHGAYSRTAAVSPASSA